MTKIVYVKWLDASFTNASTNSEEFDPRAELYAQGFLVRETKDVISISIERDGDDTEDDSRMWLNIPKGSIIDLRVRDVERAFPPKSTKKKPVVGRITLLRKRGNQN